MNPLPEDDRSPIGEEDRENAVRRLQEAYAEGRISHEEMDASIQAALTATTQGGLVSALSPLPPESAGTVSTSTIAAVSGRIRRRGAWRVPRTVKVESAFAAVNLDLSRAVIEHRVVDIELRLGTGQAKITVPRDAVVDIEGLSTTWKDSLYKTPRSVRSGGPTIRVSGTMGFGRLKIRHARH